MARQGGTGPVQVYNAAGQWVDRCLRRDGSLFTPGREIWSASVVQDLHERFVERPDESDRDFMMKFRDQLAGAPPETVQLAAETLLLPMVVMFVPMMAILFQLEAHYAFAPLPPGSVQLLKLQLDGEQAALPATAVTLDLPPGVLLDAPPVRTPHGEVIWRLRLQQPGDHVLTVHAGEQTVTKRIAVGGEPRRVPVLRTKSWEAFLYPGEEPLPRDGPLASISLKYPERDLGWMPGGEGGILATFFVLSIAAGLALKGVFHVTL